MLAGNQFLEFELLGYAGVDLLKCQCHLNSQVRSSRLAFSAAASCTAAAESAETAESASSENITEHGEYVVHGHSCATESAASAESGCTVQSVKSELVVFGALVRVAQHAVSLGCLLELLLGLLVAGVLVRVVLDGFLAVCLLYLIGGCGLGDLKHLVVVSFCHMLILLRPLWRGAEPCR